MGHKSKTSKRLKKRLTRIPWEWFVGTALLAGAFLVLKMFTINDYAGDEHIYLYQAKLVSNGIPPYSGFAAAHPPVQLLFGALALDIFGAGLHTTRFLPIFFALSAGLIIAVLLKRELGTVASLTGMTAFLFAYELLRASSHFTGVNMTIALMLGAVLAFRKEYLKTAAALCVLAVFTRLYAIPGVMALVLFSLVADWRRGLRLCAWGAGLGTLAFVVTGLWCGFEETLHNMVAYHAQKTPMDPDKLTNMHNAVLFHNAVPLSLFALSVPLLLGRFVHGVWKQKSDVRFWNRLRFAVTDAGTGLPLLALLTALLFAGILLSMDRVWMYYYIPALAFAAISAGYVGAFLSQTIRGWLRSERPIPATVVAIALLGTFAVAVVNAPALEQNLAYWEKEQQKTGDDRINRYEWKDGLLPDALNQLVRHTVWSDTRIVGDRYSAATFLLWHESRYFDIADDIVNDIQSRSGPSDRIFGDSGTVPLLALRSGRDIAADEVDTNIQRYISGNADTLSVVKAIDRDDTRLIFLRMNGRRPFGVAGVKEVRELVGRHYKLVKKYRTRNNKQFLLFQRK